ncbi:MAG: 30S ribosomal protein S17 [bacterium]|nr:30S ribosomal protein S17 [bacterium]
MAEVEETFGGRVIEGRVIKAGGEKTRVVVIEMRAPHRVYGKGIKRTSKAVAHDENNESGVGDIVRLRECRPISKTKRWRLVQVLTKAAVDG